MNDPLQTTLVSVRVSGRGEDGATAFARSHSFVVGRPINFDEKAPRLSAVEMLTGVIAADVVTGFQWLAARRRLVVDEVEARAEGAVAHPLVHLGVVGEEGEPHLSRLTIRAYISTFEPEEKISVVWNESLRRSPLINTFKRAADLDVSFQLIT